LLVEPPVELPEPIEPEPLPPVEPLPVLGELVLGDFVLLEPLEVPPLLMPDELPVELLVPPEAPDEPDLLKWASHSARDICPLLSLSTSEKLGVDVLPDDEDVPPADDEPDEPELPEVPPLADDGEDDEEDGEEDEDDEDGRLDEPLDEPLDPPVALLPVADGDEDEGLLDEDEDCATASVDSANSTAAAVTLRVFRIWRSP